MLPLGVKEEILILAQSFPSLLRKLNNFHMDRLHKTYGIFPSPVTKKSTKPMERLGYWMCFIIPLNGRL